MKEITNQDPMPATQDGFIAVRNVGEPIRFSVVEPLAGVTAESAIRGQQVKVWSRLSTTSDDPLFHRVVEDLEGVLRQMTLTVGATVSFRRANTILLVLKPDRTAELWVDTAAVSLQCRVKRAISAGSLVFEQDIADVTGMGFPKVDIGEKDQVLCLFREGWGFGLAFDFNPDGRLDLAEFSATLGTLYRSLHYRHLYETINDPDTSAILQAAGWFPFVEIISSEFRDLAKHARAGFELTEIEQKIIETFDAGRLDHIHARWSAKPHMATRANLLKEATDAFLARRPISTIKILLTEIEGVLNDAYKAQHEGRGAKLKELLNFAQDSAERRAGTPNSLFFPAPFGRYLAANTFGNFDPVTHQGAAGSRHAVGHGAAPQATYTMVRALQAVLTLDQLAFYI